MTAARASRSSTRASARRRTGASMTTRRRRIAGSMSSSGWSRRWASTGSTSMSRRSPSTWCRCTGRSSAGCATALRDRIPDAQLSVATQGNEIGAAMAAVAATAGADRIFLMGYDYRDSRHGARRIGAHRSDGRQGEGPRLVARPLRRRSASRSERLLLGLPLYGVTWPVIAPGFLAPSSGRGDAWVPRRNLRVFEDPTFAPNYEPTESVEFYSVPTAFADPWLVQRPRGQRGGQPRTREPRADRPGTPSTTTRRAA